jgi:anti-anti-sigma factor
MIVTTTNRLTPPAGTELRVVGEVDTYAADDLRELLGGPAVPPSGAVVVDLTGVTFMSCTALSVLAEARRRIGPRFHLGGRSRVVTRLLGITGLSPYFPVVSGNDPAPAREAGDGDAVDGGASGGAAGDGVPRAAKDGAGTWTFSRADVERAHRRLMAVHGCDPEEAWHMLARASARHGVPVGELVDLLIRPSRNPDRPPSPAAARALLTVLMRAPVDDRPVSGRTNP